MLPDVANVLIAAEEEPIRTSFLRTSTSAQSIVLPATRLEDHGPGSAPAYDAESNTIRLLIAGGHAILRDALPAFFVNIAGIQVVGEAEDGNEVFQLSCRETPHVILLEFPPVYEREMSFLCRISSDQLPMHVVMLASSFGQPGVMAAMKLGA